MKLEQIQKNIEYIFKNIENTDTDVFVDIQSQRAAEEAIRELIKASGDDEAARTAAATVTPITSNVFKDIKKIDDALMQYLGKKKSLKRKFLNVFKKDEEKQILVSTKTKNAAGRKIITIRSNLNKHIDNLQENKLQTTTLASRVVNMFIDKMISLIRTILSDEDVAQAHDQNN